MRPELDAAIDRHAEHAFAFLADLVRAPSVVGHEQPALEVFAAELEDIGLEVTRLPFPRGQIDDVRAGVGQPAGSASDRYQVVAHTSGRGPIALLLNGHIDVVPAETPHLWASPPFEPERRDGRMFGRGTADMKGGFAIGTLALRALRDVAPDLFATRRLGFVAVIEEECTGNGALWSAAAQGVLADEVVLLEPTDLGIMLGGVGVLWLDVEVRGASAHAESAHLRPNAVDLAMRVVEVVRTWCADIAITEPDAELADVASPYNLNVGVLSAGDWPSSVPASATVRLRIGYPRSWTPDEAEQRVRLVVDAATAADPDFPVAPRLRTSGLRARGYHLAADHPLVTDLAKAHLDAHGVPPRTFSMGSTTDARTYLNDFGRPAVCFGAVTHDMHGIDESVELQSIVDGARTLARFLLMRFAPSLVPGPDR